MRAGLWSIAPAGLAFGASASTVLNVRSDCNVLKRNEHLDSNLRRELSRGVEGNSETARIADRRIATQPSLPTPAHEARAGDPGFGTATFFVPFPGTCVPGYSQSPLRGSPLALRASTVLNVISDCNVSKRYVIPRPDAFSRTVALEQFSILSIRRRAAG